MVSVFYAGKEMSFRSSILYLKEQLPEKSFIRTHRSYIINLKYISCIRQRSIILTTGQEVPIGVTYAKIFGHEFSRYLEDSNAVKI
jgi:DNA-binding LytR/AlgR family response regulator